MRNVIRISVIGTGMIANSAHLPALSEYVRDKKAVIEAVADTRIEAAQETAARFGVPRYYDDPMRMLEEVESDLVIVCTPNAYHKQWTISALKHGANVLCEKPIAVSAADAREMYTAARRAGKTLFAGQCLRWSNDIQAAQELLSVGEIGKPYFADLASIRRYGVPSWGMFHMKRHNFGGPFCDIGVHAIDSLLWLTGNPKLVSVSGSGYSCILGKCGDVLGSLSDSGAPAGLFTPRKYDPSEFSVEEFSAGRILFEDDFSVNFKIAWAVYLPSMDLRLDIAGDEGGLSVDKHTLYKNVGRYQSETVYKPYDNRAGKERPFSLHYYMYEDVFRCLYTGEPFRVTEEEAVNMADIIGCYYESAESAMEVRAQNGK